MDYIGRYKDQKADSYWGSGFVNTVKTYEQKVKHNQFFIYGKKGYTERSFTTVDPHVFLMMVRKRRIHYSL